MGRMDDVQAYSLFEGILMIVCPHVYLQISQHTPPMALSDEVASAHWVDLEQILCRVDHPTASFSHEYRAISFDMASRLFPKHARRQSLWFRIHSWVLGKIHYTMLPLRFTGDNSIVRQPSDAGSRSRFASDTELYLWGISLGMASSLVDLSLPVDPRVLGPGYVSVTSPWPQLDRYRWADVNLVTNFIHCFAWSPGRRKPWLVRVKHTPSGRVVGPATDYFLSYFGVLQVVFPLSCLAKLALLCMLGRGAARLAARLVR
ncbi:hypothetical protein LPJ61_004290 [Coemansia biformis]|uniref:Nudix hydrolase domain-containing protein n=1 Tax=Coemansia biformis TaxID=1286918 RepID=A0A9W7Y9K3_9FUNG|nr:hypothetical protein LPJ61_004290 [Coemansia biformis]